MKYIESFELKEKFHNIEPFACEFIDGLNVIVGENGCGKSTMLWLMSNPDFVKKENVARVKLVHSDNQVTFKFLDTEKQNPRMKDPHQLPSSMFGVGIVSRFKSHGQVIFPLVKAVENMKGQITFIDEPEAGVSLSNQKKLMTCFKKAVKNDCQVIITTHSYVIIKNTEIVYDLEKRKWIDSQKYIESLKL